MNTKKSFAYCLNKHTHMKFYRFHCKINKTNSDRSIVHISRSGKKIYTFNFPHLALGMFYRDKTTVKQYSFTIQHTCPYKFDENLSVCCVENM